LEVLGSRLEGFRSGFRGLSTGFGVWAVGFEVLAVLGSGLEILGNVGQWFRRSGQCLAFIACEKLKKIEKHVTHDFFFIFMVRAPIFLAHELKGGGCTDFLKFFNKKGVHVTYLVQI
jgi:hypothetical protein